MAVCLVAAFALSPWVARLPASLRVLGLLLAVAAAAHQVVNYRDKADSMIEGIDVTGTREYRATEWLDRNLHGLRTFASGETGFWANVFTDTPQLTSGHWPFNPNHVLDFAGYELYSDDGAGEQAAQISVLWLKAFGCHAILVGPSRFYGEIFVHPRKFDGILPVLWHEGEGTIYSVPQRTSSLAHVIPADAVVSIRRSTASISTGSCRMLQLSTIRHSRTLH